MIKHTTLIDGSTRGSVETVLLAYNKILSAYAWETGSSVTEGNRIDNLYGTYYFTTDSYIKISGIFVNSGSYGRYYGISIDVVTPNGTKNVYKTTSSGSKSEHWKLSVGTTSKGVCICAQAVESNTNTRDPHFYNLYVGEITLLDGTTTKGCIYVNDDDSYIVATDEGISTESTFTSIIDSTRKGFLVPVTDSTHGVIFKDIYMMACAPVQYNKFKIVDTGNKYLAGKAICLAD